jgi:anti-sigma factor RsiW
MTGVKKARMNCDRVQTLLDAYIDGELDLVNALDLEEHLKDCPECAQRYAELLDLRAAINDSRAVLYRTPPQDLRKKIQSSLRTAEREANPKRGFNLQWRWSAAALVIVAIAVAAGFAAILFAPQTNNLLASEVQVAHVRSLMADHLMDVVSTDQHTVKPWFNGKLDFSPPVVDLAAQGYPLQGGRLDYLDGQSVAALVYHRNKHIINLFIWPSTEKINGVQSSSNNGFNLYHWDQSSMQYWAVSDLNTAELQTFVELVQKNFK